MTRRTLLCVVLVAASVAVEALSARAEQFPSRPLELVILGSPGGGAARYGQMMAQLVSKKLGQPIEAVYKPGGSGNEALVYMTQQPADGHTLSMWSMSRAGYMNLPGFQLSPDDFTYLLATEKQAFTLAVATDSPYRTIQDLIADSKANPGKVTIGATRVGSIHHRLVTAFTDAAHIRTRYIPYKGSGDVTKDLLGKHLPVGLVQPGLLLPQIKAGKLRALIVLNEDRLAEMPDVPVPADLGYRYDFVHQMYGVMLKKGVPEERQQRLRDAFKEALADPEYVAYVKANPGVIPMYLATKELTTLFYRALKDFRQFLVEANIPVRKIDQ